MNQEKRQQLTRAKILLEGARFDLDLIADYCDLPLTASAVHGLRAWIMSQGPNCTKETAAYDVAAMEETVEILRAQIRAVRAAGGF